MKYVFGEKSEANLSGVHPDLVKVVRYALEISDMDFSVHEGLRTVETQAEYFVSGASHKILSRHLTGHAVDLYPFIAGKTRTDEGLFPTLADAMRLSSVDCQIPIEWGAAWGKPLALSSSANEARNAYLTQCRLLLKKPFNDFVHFQLPEKQYPADPALVAKLDGLVRAEISNLKDERGLA